MKIYTKKGDQGLTSLFGGGQYAKDYIRIEAYGSIDELNAHLGNLRDQLFEDEHTSILLDVQNLILEQTWPLSRVRNFLSLN